MKQKYSSDITSGSKTFNLSLAGASLLGVSV